METASDYRRTRVSRLVTPTFSASIGALFGALAFVLNSRSLTDNSSFTHIATGRLVVADGIPSVDPYSFTAPGVEWVVQSWLASLLYGLVDAWGGGAGLELLSGVLAAILVLLVWCLTRPAHSLIVRVAVTGLVLIVGLTFWAPRPLLIGLVLLATLLVVVTEQHDPRWLVPIMWAWVNCHGSFPLGLVAIATLAVGRMLDRDVRDGELLAPESAEPPTRREYWWKWLSDSAERASLWQALVWATFGTLLGAINPLGPKILIFPVHLLGRMDVLQRVVEWQSPSFKEASARVFLAQLVLVAVVLVRRPRYSIAVPFAAFFVAALLGMRNVPVASLVMVPGLATGMAGLGRLRGDERGPVPLAFVAAAVAALLVVVPQQLQKPAYDLESYPVNAIVWLDQRGVMANDIPVVSQDTTGNLLELIYGADSRVFIDDRYDMYPVALLRDYITIHGGAAGWEQALERYGVRYVLWSRDHPFTQLIAESSAWRVLYQDPKAFVACRRSDESCKP